MKWKKMQWLKRFSATALAATLTVTGLPTTAMQVKAASKDIIANGTFDKDDSNWVEYLAGYSGENGWTGIGTPSKIYVSDLGHAANGCMKLTGSTISKNPATGAKQDIDGKLQKGETYDIEAWVYYTAEENPQSKEENNFNICVSYGTDWSNIKAYTGTVKRGEWTKVSATFTVPTDIEDARLEKAYVYTESCGWKPSYEDSDLLTYYVDDVSLKKQGPADPDAIIDPETQIKLEAGNTKTPGRNNPLIDYQLGADPYAMEYDGRVYIYVTNDSQEYDAVPKNDEGCPTANNSFANINTLTVLSSSDMVNWTNHGNIPVAGGNGIAKWAKNSWAPAACHKTIDGKEQFFLYFADGGGGIGVLVADSPVGPFREPGEAGSSQLIKWGTQASEGVVWLFDPAVLVDDDGTGYLYYGGGVPAGGDDMPGTSRVVKLKDNMVELDGDAKQILAPAVFEDSGIHKYKDTYYYTYCSNFSNNVADTGRGNICVMTSDNPMGPFTYQGIAFTNPSTYFNVGGNNHHCFFEFNGKQYFTYHAQTVTKSLGIVNKAGGYRSTHIQEIEYDETDTTKAPVIKSIVGTYEGVAQTQDLDPYTRVEAETIGWAKGIVTEDCTEAGSIVESINQKVTGLTDGDYIAVSKAAFGTDGAKTFTMKAKPLSGGNTVEIYLDAPNSTDGTKVGEIVIPVNDVAQKNLMEMDYWKFAKEETPSAETTGAEGWQEYSCEVTGVTGTHDVYIVMAEGTEIQTKKAAAVDTLIDAIGEVACTEESKAKIDTARTAYYNLSTDQRKLVTKLTTLKNAENTYKDLYNADAAAKVDAKIEAIGEVAYTTECKSLIDVARAAYDNLTEEQQALVTKAEILIKAETDYAALEAAAGGDDKDETDQKAAAAVIAKIQKIGTVEYTEASRARIDEARAAYDALTEAQQALVTNVEDLTKAEADYAALKAAADMAAADKKAADAVKALIASIGTVTNSAESKSKIDEARTAFDKLTEAQKVLVDNVQVLTKAEADYKELSSKPSDTTNPPSDTTNPPSGDSSIENEPKEGATYTVGSYSYKVTSLANKTVSVVKTTKQSATISIGSTVKIEGVSFKITEIAKNAFKGNKKVTTVKGGKNLKTIGANAFSGCTKLAKVTIDSKELSKIDTKAFYNCKKLKAVKLSSSKIKTVGKQAFKGIEKKAKIDVPNKKAASYKKLFQKQGLAKTAVVK